MTEVIIIYKSYTPQRKAYAKKYYQLNKKLLLTRQKEYYENTKEDNKQNLEFKEQQKAATLKYMNKINDNPEALERVKQRRRDYYQRMKELKILNLTSQSII